MAKSSKRLTKIKKAAPSITAVDSFAAPSSKISPSRKVLVRYLVVALLIVLAAVFFWKNKSLLVVAMVNGRPISRLELEKRIVSRYGAQTLDEIVNEQLILQEGAKKAVKISDKEIADKVAEIEKSLGGKITLKDALAGQGLSMEEFQWQIRLQLTLEKLAGANVTVSEQEITDYLDKNRASMTATDEAGLKEEALSLLTAQKKSDSLRQLFQDLKAQAKITKYL